jgi:hypothetical protein
MRQNADDDFERHESDNQDERDRQVPSIGVRLHRVGVLMDVMVMMTAILMRSHCASGLFQVRANNLHQISGRRTLVRLCLGTSKHMLTYVIFDHFRHQAVHRTTGRRDQAEHVSTFGLAFEGTSQRVDLALDSGRAMQQALFFANRVQHVDEYTPSTYD